MLVSAVIRSHLRGTPMEGLEKEFTKCAIDPLLMIAIGTAESGLGKSYADWFNEEHHNPFGLMSDDDLIQYACWEDAIKAECQLLTRLIGKGATNLSMIGAVYATSNSWPVNVDSYYVHLLNDLEDL